MNAKIVSYPYGWNTQRPKPQHLFCDLVFSNHEPSIHNFYTILNNFVQSGIIADILFVSASADKVSKMTQTQTKLKEYFDELLRETDHTAKHGDHSSHSGHFDSVTGYGEPPYTGEGLSAEQDLKEWEEFMKDPLAMFDWDYTEQMPELAKIAFEEWLEIQDFSVIYATTHLMPQLIKFVVQAFARDFFEVATGKSFEVVSL